MLFITCLIGMCQSAAINNILPEPEKSIPENAVEEVNDNQTADLETAEFKHFGPRVVVINKGYGGYHGGGGYRGCGCGGGYSHYHSHHRYGYGKKK